MNRFFFKKKKEKKVKNYFQDILRLVELVNESIKKITFLSMSSSSSPFVSSGANNCPRFIGATGNFNRIEDATCKIVYRNLQAACVSGNSDSNGIVHRARPFDLKPFYE